jgi:hypothetical protein
MLISHWISRISFLAVGTLPLIVCSATRTAQTEAPAKIFAQKLVTETLAAHAELMGFELAATPPGKDQCVTIASNEAKGIGEKCDKDEFAAMKTNKPFVEKEKENGKEVCDVTIPIHDNIATSNANRWPRPPERSRRAIRSQLTLTAICGQRSARAGRGRGPDRQRRRQSWERRYC